MPAAEDTYLPASQLCTEDPNTKTGKHFITLMLNSKKKKRPNTGTTPANCGYKHTKHSKTKIECDTMIKTFGLNCVH